MELDVLSPVHFRNVVPSDLLDALLRNVPRKRHGQVVAQRAQFTTLVRQVVNQLRVLAILARQDFLELEDGRVDRDGTVALENGLDCARKCLVSIVWSPLSLAQNCSEWGEPSQLTGIEDLFTQYDRFAVPILCALGRL